MRPCPASYSIVYNPNFAIVVVAFLLVSVVGVVCDGGGTVGGRVVNLWLLLLLLWFAFVCWFHFFYGKHEFYLS